MNKLTTKWETPVTLKIRKAVQIKDQE